METIFINSYRNCSYDLVGEYGSWLKGFNWDLFGTLTFDSNRGTHSQSSREKQLKDYIVTLERQSRAQVRCFWSEEKRWSGCGKAAIAPHYHVLLACDRLPLQPDPSRLLWEASAGIADMRTYDPSRNAAEYCAKLVGLSDPHYGFVGFPKPKT